MKPKHDLFSPAYYPLYVRLVLLIAGGVNTSKAIHRYRLKTEDKVLKSDASIISAIQLTGKLRKYGIVTTSTAEGRYRPLSIDYNKLLTTLKTRAASSLLEAKKKDYAYLDSRRKNLRKLVEKKGALPLEFFPTEQLLDLSKMPLSRQYPNTKQELKLFEQLLISLFKWWDSNQLAVNIKSLDEYFTDFCRGIVASGSSSISPFAEDYVYLSDWSPEMYQTIKLIIQDAGVAPTPKRA